MINEQTFKTWLICNTDLTRASINDVLSRVRRANKMLEIYDDPLYMYYLSNLDSYKTLSVNVRSQIKRAVTLYLKCLVETT